MMMEKIGVSSIDELLTAIPSEIKDNSALKLPPALDELALKRHLKTLSNMNLEGISMPSFLGAGTYNHFIPSAIDHLISRSEFYTAYTPYQPEISQGTLQAIFEFQTMICLLTGMDVANASMYDGASALAEAVLMAKRINKKGQKVYLSKAVHPEYREVVKTYTNDLDIEIIEIPYDEGGKTDLKWLAENMDDTPVAIAVQYPNFFGIIEDMTAISKIASDKGALFISATTEPIALGLIKPPAHYGVDIAVGEGQSLGNAVNFGGPHLGLFATKKEYLRNMPGRLAGETVDLDGKKGYVLTLSTREQHIRREKATSNICSNQSLCALTASIYLSLLGKRGLRSLASTNLSLAEYAKNKLSGLPGFSLPFNSPTFNEFVVKTDKPAEEINEKIFNAGIIGGLPLGKFYPELNDSILFCVTEMSQKSDIDKLVEVLND
jgi:glycine dehydrogenase subunit 1